jgi:hypothetical protein
MRFSGVLRRTLIIKPGFLPDIELNNGVYMGAGYHIREEGGLSVLSYEFGEKGMNMRQRTGKT